MSFLYARDGVSSVQPPLSQTVGYIIVVLIGVIIALGKNYSESLEIFGLFLNTCAPISRWISWGP